MNRRVRSNRFYFALLALLALVSTFAAARIWWQAIAGTHVILNVLLTVLFSILFLWISIGFWTATFGFIRQLTRSAQVPQTPAAPSDSPLPKTAILMPVYNEDPATVIANVRAICDDLQLTGRAAGFDFFILSDTTDADIWLEEESAFAWARLHHRGDCEIFYRRRPQNTGRKCGNIADFCQRWGARYPYMIILDADSLMAGSTLVEMVRKMENSPRAGIIQVPPVPVNRKSMLARLQQFSARFYGDLFNAGFALWTQKEGNYFGHNAIIRTRPFAECCGLSLLPGKPPLGGELLSHDFVEAALIQSAGWQVIVADDLAGSYEECPTNLKDFAKRDQRWCQGNMQHLRLVFSRRMKPASRIHLAMGVMSFVASPLWLCFLILTVMRAATADRFFADPASRTSGAVLFAIVMLMLLWPKIAALLAALRRPSQLAAFGGAAKTAASVFIETITSIITAPIMMLYHTYFVIAVFLRRSVSWDNQQRSESRVTLHEAIAAHALHTIVGLAAAVLIQLFAPTVLPWISPVLIGLIFSIPAAMLLGSRYVGLRLRHRRLLLIPEEFDAPPIIRRRQRHLARYLTATRRAPHAFLRAIADPALSKLHAQLLPSAAAGPEPIGQLEKLARVALAGGEAHLSRDDRMTIASDPLAMEWLHLQAWKEWPLPLLEQIALAAKNQKKK